MSSPIGFTTPTRLLYADGVFTFYKGHFLNMQGISNAFKLYSSLSGQWVNKDKIWHNSWQVLPGKTHSLPLFQWLEYGVNNVVILNRSLLWKFTWKFITSVFCLTFLQKMFDSIRNFEIHLDVHKDRNIYFHNQMGVVKL